MKQYIPSSLNNNNHETIRNSLFHHITNAEPIRYFSDVPVQNTSSNGSSNSRVHRKQLLNIIQTALNMLDELHNENNDISKDH